MHYLPLGLMRLVSKNVNTSRQKCKCIQVPRGGSKAFEFECSNPAFLQASSAIYDSCSSMRLLVGLLTVSSFSRATEDVFMGKIQNGLCLLPQMEYASKCERVLAWRKKTPLSHMKILHI